MVVLARKIARAKWDPKPEMEPDEIAADAVTIDLKTTGNTLSFWRCASAESKDLRSAVLALASNAERPDKIDVVWVDESSMLERRLAIEATSGDTPVVSLRERHVDVVRLDFFRLGRVAELVSLALRNGQCQRLTKKEIVELLADAVRKDLLLTTELKSDMREAVEKKLAIMV